MGNEKDLASRDAARESSLASGWTVEGQLETEPTARGPQIGEQAAGHADPLLTGDAAIDTKQMSNGALVLLGVIGGVYLLFTFVWFGWANAQATNNAMQFGDQWSLDRVLQQITVWIAPFAPALWFVTVLTLCRGAKIWRIVLWLALGFAVTVPLPFFGGAF